jgi:hypothetical protein
MVKYFFIGCLIYTSIMNKPHYLLATNVCKAE